MGTRDRHVGRRNVDRRESADRRESVGRRDSGAIAAEFALLTTLLAAVTFGVAAVLGASLDQPLEALAGVLAGLTGANG